MGEYFSSARTPVGWYNLGPTVRKEPLVGQHEFARLGGTNNTLIKQNTGTRKEPAQAGGFSPAERPDNSRQVVLQIPERPGKGELDPTTRRSVDGSDRANVMTDTVVLVRETEGTDKGGASLSPVLILFNTCLLYTSPSPRDRQKSRMPSSA